MNSIPSPATVTDSAILETLPVAIHVCDRDGRLLRFNQRARDLCRRLPSPGDDHDGVFRVVRADGETVPWRRSPAALVCDGHAEARAPDLFVEREDGSRIAVVLHAMPLLDADGQLVGAVTAMQEAADAPAALAEAREALRARTDLLATVAHELKQPIAAAVSALNVMALRAGREPGVHARTTLLQQLNQMRRLVDDLLEVEHDVRGEVRLAGEPVDLVALVRQVADAVRPLTAAHGQHLELALPDHPCRTVADAGRLQQVLMNILDNASKYTPRGGRIGVSLAESDDEVRIAVTDTGRGLESSALSRIFEPFTRQATDGGGLGAGLAIARHIVARHGGTIHARSDGPGRGSEFVVVLPRRPARADSGRP